MRRRNYGYGYGGSSSSNEDYSKDFALYSNPKTKLIEQDGMEKMGKAIGINIYEDLFLIYFMYKCDTKKLESIQLIEYTKGLTSLGISKFEDLKKKKNDYKSSYCYSTGRNNYNNETKSFFNFLFTINMDKQKKRIDFMFLEAYLFPVFNCYYGLVKTLINFLKEKKIKDFNSDEWNSFYDFFDQLGGSFPQGYSIVSGAWTCILDDFYYYYMEKNKLTIPKENLPENYYCNS